MPPVTRVLRPALAVVLVLPLADPAAASVTLRADFIEPIPFVPAPRFEVVTEDIYRVEAQRQRFRIDGQASVLRHVDAAPVVAPPGGGEDRVVDYPLAGTLTLVLEEHYWEQESRFLRDGAVLGTLRTQPLHRESTLRLEGSGLTGTPAGFALPGLRAVQTHGRYRADAGACGQSFGPEPTYAACSSMGGPWTHYEAVLEGESLLLEAYIDIPGSDFLAGSEYYALSVQATAVPAPAAAWLLGTALLPLLRSARHAPGPSRVSRRHSRAAMGSSSSSQAAPRGVAPTAGVSPSRRGWASACRSALARERL
jgi:hypothetical protein